VIIHQAWSPSFFPSIIQLFKIWFLEFLNTLQDGIFKFSRIFYKTCNTWGMSCETQTSVFQIKNTRYTVNNFSEIFDVPIRIKIFVRVVFELFNFVIRQCYRIKDNGFIKCGSHWDLNIVFININLSIFIICKNGPSIINTRSILLLFYIHVKSFLRTIIINTNTWITKKLKNALFKENMDMIIIDESPCIRGMDFS